MVFKLPTSYLAIKALRWKIWQLYIFIIHNQLIWLEGNSKDLIPRNENKNKTDCKEMGLGGQTTQNLKLWRTIWAQTIVLTVTCQHPGFLCTRLQYVFSWLHSRNEGHILEAGMAASVEEMSQQLRWMMRGRKCFRLRGWIHGTPPLEAMVAAVRQVFKSLRVLTEWKRRQDAGKCKPCILLGVTCDKGWVPWPQVGVEAPSQLLILHHAHTRFSSGVPGM